MKIASGALLIALTCLGCQTAPRDDSAYLSRALVGLWEFEYGDEPCPGHAIVGFRANGTMTRTSSDCDMVSDGFGHYYYGWYVAKNAICMVGIEEELDDRSTGLKRPKLYRRLYLAKVREGFVAERCTWKVVGYTWNGIVVDLQHGTAPVTFKRSTL